MKQLLLIITVLLPMAAPSAARADYIEPGLVSVKTENYTPVKRDFSSGVYRYKVAWQGIPVADAEVDVRNDEIGPKPTYTVTANAETGDVIRWFYRMNHTSNSVFDAQSFRPIKFMTHQRERSRDKGREVSFGPDGTIEFLTTRYGVAEEKKEFKSDNNTLDPISAAFVARSLPIDLGTKASFDVFNGKHRYLITCEVQAREKITVAGREYDAFRVIPEVKKLTDTKGEDRLQSVTLWISADSARHVLKLESKVWVGSVSAEMTAFEATEPEYTIRASLRQ